MSQHTAQAGAHALAPRTLFSGSNPNRKARFGRRLLALLSILAIGGAVQAQSSANYTFATNTTGSLIQDKNGNAITVTSATAAVTSSTDQGSTLVTNIGFDFYFMGSRFSQFSASSNGIVQLGSSAVSTSSYLVSDGTATAPKFSAYGADLGTGTNGSIKSQTIGTAPNRCLVIEFNNMTLLWTSSYTNDGTYQVRLYEDGTVEYVYGAMSITATSGASDKTPAVGFAAGTAANTFAYVTTSTNGNATTGTFTDNPTPSAGALANLNSASNGSRRVYRWTPAAPAAAPTNLSFTAGSSSITLNWTASSPTTNSLGYAVYSSTDNSTFTYAGQTALGTNTFTVAGLTAATTYYWQVYAISEGARSSALTGTQATNAAGTVTSTATGGNWSSPATWANNAVPGPLDDAVIADNATVTIDASAGNPTVKSLTVGGGTSGILQYNTATAQTLTVTGAVTINSGAKFQTGATGTITSHKLVVGGNLTNNGTLDFSTNSNTAGADLTFNTAGSVSFSGTGTKTNLYTLTMSKSVIGDIVDMNLSNFQVRSLSTSATGALLTSASGTGTLKISGTNTFSGTLWSSAAYTINSSLGIWLNNPNFTVQAQGGTATLSGSMRISAGTYNVGTASGNNFTTSSATSFTMEGGTFNAGSRFVISSGTFSLSGGTINASAVANATANASFTMSTSSAVTISGGTINLVQASTNASQTDYNFSSTATITGGTLNIGTGTTATKYSFVIQGNTPALTIDNTTNNKTATLAGATNVYGATTVNTGTTLTLAGYVYTQKSGNFTNNGTVTGTATSSRLYFGGNSAQALAGTGTFTAGIDGMTFDNPAGVTISHTNVITTLRVNLYQGVVTNSNKLTIGNGGTTSAVVQAGSGSSSFAGGSFDAAPTFNAGSGGIQVIYAQESGVRTTGFELPATRNVLFLTINNTNGVTLAGGALSAGTLTLTAGRLTTTSSNLLTVTGTATTNVSGGTTTSYVNGPLARTLPASLATGSTYTFPVGKSGYNAFELVNPTTGSGGTVVVQAEAFDGDAGGTPSAAFSSLSTTRYWQVAVNSGSANFTNTLVKLNDTRGSYTGIGRSTTQNGSYGIIGSAATQNASYLQSTTPAVTSLPGFYLMGVLAPPALSSLTVTPAGVNCSANVQRSVSVAVSGGVAPYTVTLSYSVNGGTTQNVTMSNGGSGSVYTGTIPTVTPANGYVTWSISVTDANALNSTLAGTAYRDMPLTGVTPTMTASPTTICAGAPVLLTSSTSYVAGTPFTETFETFPVTSFTTTIVSGTPAVAQSTSYFAQGSSSVRFSAGSSADVAYAMASNLGLAGYSSAQLTFSHILASEGGVDFGYVQYSTDGGNNWTSFPTSSYAGSGTLKNSVVSFDKTSYTEWSNNFTTSSVNPTNALWKSETINIPTAALTNQFRLRFRYTSDGSVNYYGWLIDNVKITGSNTFSNYLWSTGDQTSTNTFTVNPTTSGSYGVIGLDANGCTSNLSALTAITVNPVPSAPTANNSSQCGTQVPTASVTSTSGFSSPTFRWYAATTGGTALTANYPATTGATITTNTFPASINATTTFYVTEMTAAGCESGRTPVTVSVSTPDAITAASNLNNVCPNTALSLSATQQGSVQSYSYSWTAAPAAGSGIPSGSVSGNPASVTPTAGGTYTYTVTAVDGSCSTTATVSVTITAPPAISTITATPTTVCSGATLALAATSIGTGSGTAASGTGTVAASGEGVTPFAQHYESVHTQYLVLASDLQSAGLRAGNLTGVSFNVTSGLSTKPFLNYTVKMAHTSSTGLSALLSPTFTPVYGPATYPAVSATGTSTVTFTTPFNWDGSSNILVDICFANDPDGSGGTQYTANSVVSGTTKSYTAAYGYYSDNTTLCGTTGGSQASSSVLPNMTFAGTTNNANITNTLNWTWNPGSLSGASVSATAPVNTSGSNQTQAYTVSVTNPVTGCTNTSSVNVTVNPAPTAPTATGSTQCGLHVPTATVASTSGLPTPTFKWYDAASGGSLLQTGTSTTYTTAISATTTFYVSEINTTTGCEGARTAVTVTVTVPDAVTVTTASSLCLGNAASLTATQTGSTNNYTFAWTAAPAAGSGIPSGSVSGSPASVTPTTVGTYTYTVTATEAATSCVTTATKAITVNSLPVTPTVTATPSTVCSGGTVALAANSVVTGTGTTTLGNGDSTTTWATTVSPYFYYYGGSKNQYIFKASELQAAGLRAGNLTSLSFEVTSLGVTSLSSFSLSIGHTAQNNGLPNTMITTGLTTVYSKATQTVTTGVNTYTFTTPFNWDGTSNIVLSVCFSNVNSGGTSTIVKSDETSFVSYSGIFADYASASSLLAAVSASNTDGGSYTGYDYETKRPKTTFGGTVATNLNSGYTWNWTPGNLGGASTSATAPVNTSGSPLTQPYTATATIAATGCTASVSVNVTVNAAPTAPTATGSTQCGLAVPTATVASTSGLPTPTFKWYDAASGGNLLQTSTSTTYTTAISATTTFYVSEINTSTGCEGARTAVTVNVVTPDPITASANGPVCLGGAITLQAAQTGSVQNYVYAWAATPASGSGIPTTVGGTSVTVTPTAAGTYTYTVTGTDASLGCAASASVSVVINPNPAITTATASPATICSGATVSLGATSIGTKAGTVASGTQSTTSSTYSPYRSGVGADAKTQYLFTAAELQAAGLRAGNITSLAFTVTTLGDGVLPDFTISMGQTSATALTTTFATTTLTPVLGPVNYTAVSGANTHTFTTPFAWDGTSNLLVQVCHSLSGGFTSSTVAANTASGNVTTYASANNACAGVTTGTASASRPVITFGGTVVANNTSLYTWSWTPGSASGATATVTPPANTSGSVVTQAYTVTATNATTGCFSSATTPAVSINPAPTAPTPTSSTQCGLHVPTASVASTSGLSTPTFKWYDAASGGNLLQTGTSTTYTTAISATTTFYVSEINTATGCEGARTAVTVTVNTPDAVTATSNGPVCQNGALTLTATKGSGSNDYSYTWTAAPAAGSGIPSGSVSGSPASVTPTAGGTFVYTVTANDAVSGCTTTAQVSVLVNPGPAITTITANPTNVCPGGAVALNATSVGIIAGTPTIGTQSSSDYTGGPYRSGAGLDNKAQWIILASELQAANISAGPITSLAFNVTSLGSGAMPNFTIKMGQTSATSLTSTFDAAALTTVLNPVSYTAVAGVNTHTFNTPFVWDGTSNLIIQVCHDALSSTSTSVALFSTSFNSVSYVNTSGACAATSGGSTTTNRPVMTLGAQVSTSLTGSYTWTWNPGNLSGASVSTTAQNSAGVQTFTAVATNTTTGCTTTATVNVNVGGSLTASATSAQAALCAGASTSLSATATGGGAPYTYSWKDAANNTLGTTASVNVTPTQTTTYTVTVTDNCGTQATANVTVTVNPLPVTTLTPSGTANVCAASQLLTSATSAASPAYQWYYNGNILASATTSSYTATTSGAFSVKVTDGVTGCVATSAATTINLQAIPGAITVSPAQVGCSNIAVNLTANASASGYASASWTSGTQSSQNGSSSFPAPYSAYYGGQRMQFLVLASELSAQGFGNGSRLYSISFPVVSLGSAWGGNITSLQNFQVKVGTTSQATLTSFQSGLTTVVAAGSFTPVVGYNNTHTFSSPVVWDGTSNLIFETTFSNNITGTASRSVIQYNTTTAFASTVVYRADGATASDVAAATSNNASASTTRPEFRLQGDRLASSVPNLVQYTWSANPAAGSGLSAGQQTAANGNKAITVTPTGSGAYTYTVTASIPGSTCTSTNTVAVTVNAPSTAPATLNASASGTLCPGSNVILTQTGGSLGTGAYWQWYTDAAFTQTVGGQLSSANAQLTVAPSATTSYYLRAEGGTAPCAATVAAASPVTITVYSASVGGTLTASQSFCSGSTPADLTLTGANGTIQWQSATDAAFTQNVVNYSGSAATLSGTTIGALTQTRYVRAVVTNGGGCQSANSNTITLTVNAFPVQYTVTGTGTYCDGIGRTVGLSGSQANTSYQLRLNGNNQGSPLAGTGSALSFGVQPAGTYTVVATSNAGCSATMAGSATVSSVGPFSAQIAAQNPIMCSAGNATMILITNGPANGSVTVTTNGGNAQTYTLDASGNYQFSTGILNNNATYALTSVSNGVCATTVNISTTVYIGSLMADPLPAPSVCPGSTVAPITFTGNFPAGTTYSWTSSNPAVGLAAASGNGTALPSFTATNNTNSVIFTDIAVRPNISVEGCEVRTMVFRISVKPAPTMNTVGNQVVCAGSTTAAISFSGNLSGTTYNWTNSSPAIGVAASGAGTIPSFTALNNTGLASLVGNFTVTPYNNGCAGTATNFSITVNKASVNLVYPNSPYCPVGAATPQLSGTTGGVYSAPSGIRFYSTSTGEINTELSDPGTYTVTYTVSGAAGGCGGTTTAQITILPRATINNLPNQALCAGSSTTLVQPTGAATGFSWVNLNPSVGLSATGTGAIPAFTAINNTSGIVTAQVNVTPLGNGTSSCNGNPVAYRYTIYPRPAVNTVSVPNYCRGVLTAPVTFTSATAGTSFAWTNSNTTIGLTNRGTGSLPAFLAQNPSASGSNSTNVATITVTPTANKCAGSPYVFTMTVEDCVTQSGGTGATDANARLASQVVVGPNPTQNRITVIYKGSDEGPFTVSLITQFGQVVTKPVTFTGNTYTLDLTGMTAGVYVLQFVNPRTKETVQKQVIKL